MLESIKIKLEAGSQQFLFKPEEIVNLKRSKEKYSDSDYQVNLKNLLEEQRLISGIHEAYGRLFDDLGYRNTPRAIFQYRGRGDRNWPAPIEWSGGHVSLVLGVVPA